MGPGFPARVTAVQIKFLRLRLRSAVGMTNKTSFDTFKKGRHHEYENKMLGNDDCELAGSVELAAAGALKKEEKQGAPDNPPARARRAGGGGPSYPPRHSCDRQWHSEIRRYRTETLQD